MNNVKNIKKVVFINQWVNFQTKDIINSFVNKVDEATLVYGTISKTGDSLDTSVKLKKIITYNRKNTFSRLVTWVIATIQILILIKTKYRKHYLFISTNPPMNAFLTLFCKNRYSINVLDIYPEALSLGGFISEKSWIYKVWEKQNYKYFQQADNVFTLTDGMARTISKYCELKNIQVVHYWPLANGSNDILRDNNEFIKKHNLQDYFIVMYSGNIGMGHHVASLVEAANVLKKHKDIIFVIVGEGWNKPALEKVINDNNLMNCLLLPYQPPEMFKHSIKAADLGLVSVSKELAPVCVPSKTYNLIYNEIPLLFITEGESELRSLANKYQVGKSFAPKEVNEIADYILSLKLDSKLYLKYINNLKKCAPNFTAQNAKIYRDDVLKYM